MLVVPQPFKFDLILDPLLDAQDVLFLFFYVMRVKVPLELVLVKVTFVTVFEG